MGRPSLMTPALFSLVLAEKRLGKSDVVAAELAGVSVRSVYRWMRDIPELREAFEAARAEGAQRITERRTAAIRAALLGARGDDARFPQGAVA